MVEKTATIQNDLGIHCRPSTVIVKRAKDFDADIKVIGERGESNLESVIDLMIMELHKGSKVKIQVRDGDDEEAVCDELVKLFETHFDFPPREDGVSGSVCTAGG